MKTAADLIAELQALDPETIVLVGDGLDYREPVITKIAITDYSAFAGGRALDIVGVAPARALDGQSLKGPLLSGAPVPARRQFWSQGSNFAVRDGQWKLVRQGGTPWLFNIAADRNEKTNKARGMQAKVNQLQGYINTWRRQVGR